MKQVQSCPKCGKCVGWWSKVKRISMVFFEANGSKSEHRIYEAKEKYCANCNYNITKCVRE